MRRFGRSALFLFFALIFFNPFSFGASLPVYSSHPTKSGLFPEELISLKELRTKQIKKDRFVLLDARGKDSYDSLHIAGAVLPQSADYYQKIELFRAGVIKSAPDRDKDLAEAMKKYPKNTTFVTYCNNDCQAGAVLVLQIKRLGYNDVRALDGGIQSWQASGYPVNPS